MSSPLAPRSRAGSRRAIRLSVLAILAALVPVGCADDTATSADDTATSADDTATSADDTATSADDTATSGTDAEAPVEDAEAPVEDAASGAGVVSIVVDGVDYSLSVADDIAVGGTGAFFPTRCEPDVFGAGLFSVVATAVDDTGARAQPAVTLDLVLPHDGRGSADAPPELGLSVEGDGTSALDYVLATDDGLAGVGAPPFEGELGTWTVDDNRITGEVTVFETDHERDFTTATFDITCPTP